LEAQYAFAIGESLQAFKKSAAGKIGGEKKVFKKAYVIT
jgi:hypothetical protein